MNARLKWASIFNKGARLPTNQVEVDAWRNQIENDLSPENLCCDGEISGAAVSKKLRALKAEQKELDRVETIINDPRPV